MITPTAALFCRTSRSVALSPGACAVALSLRVAAQRIALSPRGVSPRRRAVVALSQWPGRVGWRGQFICGPAAGRPSIPAADGRLSSPGGLYLVRTYRGRRVKGHRTARRRTRYPE